MRYTGMSWYKLCRGLLVGWIGVAASTHNTTKHRPKKSIKNIVKLVNLGQKLFRVQISQFVQQERRQSDKFLDLDRPIWRYSWSIFWVYVLECRKNFKEIIKVLNGQFQNFLNWISIQVLSKIIQICISFLLWVAWDMKREAKFSLLSDR